MARIDVTDFIANCLIVVVVTGIVFQQIQSAPRLPQVNNCEEFRKDSIENGEAMKDKIFQVFLDYGKLRCEKADWITADIACKTSDLDRGKNLYNILFLLSACIHSD